MVAHPRDRAVHLKEQSLPHEVLKVLPLDIAHHLVDIVVACLMEDLAVAETAD